LTLTALIIRAANCPRKEGARQSRMRPFQPKKALFVGIFTVLC
jgi:hypothetical protein